MHNPYRLLWLSARLFVIEVHTDRDLGAVVELEVSGTRLERRRTLIATDERIDVRSWCAVDDQIAVFDFNSRAILKCKF